MGGGGGNATTQHCLILESRRLVRYEKFFDGQMPQG